MLVNFESSISIQKLKDCMVNAAIVISTLQAPSCYWLQEVKSSDQERSQTVCKSQGYPSAAH